MSGPGQDLRPEEDEDLTIRGDIETSSVPALLRSLLASRETGVLTFRRGEVAKSIFMKEGQVVYAASTDPDERLGESLLLRGKITVRDYLEASKLIRPGRRLGAILVELGALEPDELIPAVEEQVREILLELMTWTYGTYELVIKEMDAEKLVTVHVNAENVILEGIRRTRSWSSLLKAIGSISTVPAPAGSSENVYKLDLTEEEQQVLAHVNGRSTVEQICQVSYLSHFETCRILWAFQVLGLVRWALPGDVETSDEVVQVQQQEMDLEGIVEKYNQMFNRIYVFLQGRHGEEVGAFMDQALEEVSRQYGALFDGVDLKQYGRADYEQMLANVADLPADQRRTLMLQALNELIYVFQFAVRREYGAEEEAVVSGIMKDGLRRLGVA